MKTIILNLILFLFVLCFQAYGQRKCGSTLNLTQIQKTEPDRYKQIMDLENRIQKTLEDPKLRSTQQPTIYIPVVVHVVYKNGTQNISDEQIKSQIDVLNKDFRRLNQDKVNTPKAFAEVAGDANIEFFLAKKDESGKSTTGITRTSTLKDIFYMKGDGVKFGSNGGKNAWNAYKYLNIWVCNLEDDLLGYAQFPELLNTSFSTDGVVISYKAFGTNGTAEAPYNKGRTTTHEIGHWLGLRHIWGDDDPNDDGGCHCDGTDGMLDTPNQSVATKGSPSFPQYDCCSKFSPGIMFMNFMDYTDDASMNIFTNDQIFHMRSVLMVSKSNIAFYSHCYNGIRDGDETGIDCGGSCLSCDVVEPTTPFKLTEYIIENRMVYAPMSIRPKIGDIPDAGIGKKVRWELKINKSPGDYNSKYSCSDSHLVYCETGYSEIYKYDKSSNIANYIFKDVKLDKVGYYYVSLKISTELNNYEDVFLKELTLHISENPYQTCNDGIQNQNETGIDCGGVCPPCGIGSSLDNLVTISNCRYGDTGILPVNNSNSLFSGKNIFDANNIKLSHGWYFNYHLLRNEKSFDYRCNHFANRTTRESRLVGGIFFEENGVQFSPDKTYKLSFNYWKYAYYKYLTTNGFWAESSHQWGPLHLYLANGLVNLANKRTANGSYGSGEDWITPLSSQPEGVNVTNKFYIGYVHNIDINKACNYGYNDYNECKYVEVSITFRPDNYYSQLWLMTGNAGLINSVKIEEVCEQNFVLNENTQNVYNPIRAENMITLTNFNHEPTEEVNLIAGKTIILKENTKITSKNGGSVHMYIDPNVCSSSTSRSGELTDEYRFSEIPSSTLLNNLEMSQSGEIIVYPNPTTGIINIGVSNEETIIYGAEVYDLNGRLVKNKNSIVNPYAFDISNQTNGIYIVRVYSSQGVSSHKIILKK